jgi:cyclopropane fatty-acyl-phospholipid synthase-like methyltransferase
MSNENGWGEYSRLVLKELETLASGIDSLRGELQEVKQEIAAMRVREDKVQELVKWKERVDEVASPSQIKDLQVQVEDLKLFKTKAVTIFAVVQFAMAAIVFAQRFM